MESFTLETWASADSLHRSLSHLPSHLLDHRKCLDQRQPGCRGQRYWALVWAGCRLSLVSSDFSARQKFSLGKMMVSWIEGGVFKLRISASRGALSCWFPPRIWTKVFLHLVWPKRESECLIGKNKPFQRSEAEDQDGFGESENQSEIARILKGGSHAQWLLLLPCLARLPGRSLGDLLREWIRVVCNLHVSFRLLVGEGKDFYDFWEGLKTLYLNMISTIFFTLWICNS